jgi:hypothetical protein
MAKNPGMLREGKRFMKTSSLLFVGLAGCAFVLGAECASKPAAQKADAESNANAADSSHKQRVIILCTGNSCRSQMAEAFWRKYAGDRWEVVSAGTKPSGKVSPLAVQAMAEKGIDISQQQSKSVTPYVGQPFDLVGNSAKMAHGFDDVARARFTLRANQSRAFTDTP